MVVDTSYTNFRRLHDLLGSDASDLATLDDWLSMSNVRRMEITATLNDKLAKLHSEKQGGMVTTYEAYLHLYRHGRVANRKSGIEPDRCSAPWTITEWLVMTKEQREGIMSLQRAALERRNIDVDKLLENFAMPTDTPESTVVAW